MSRFAAPRAAGSGNFFTFNPCVGLTGIKIFRWLFMIWRLSCPVELRSDKTTNGSLVSFSKIILILLLLLFNLFRITRRFYQTYSLNITMSSTSLTHWLPSLAPSSSFSRAVILSIRQISANLVLEKRSNSNDTYIFRVVIFFQQKEFRVQRSAFLFEFRCFDSRLEHIIPLTHFRWARSHAECTKISSIKADTSKILYSVFLLQL